MKSFLLVFTVNGKYFVELVKDDENSYSISAHKTEEEILERFEPYIRYFQGDYQQAMSATIGMMSALPTIIVAPENPEDLKNYLVEGNENPYQVQGGAIGRGFVGMEVTEDILKLKTDTEIFKTLLARAGK